MSNKYLSILNNKTGYWVDDGQTAIFILDDAETLKRKLSSGGGFRLTATAINKKTGKELDYSLYDSDNPYSLDFKKLKQFKSFGTPASTNLLDDLM